MNKKLYELTPEHKKKLEPWAHKWIKNAMSTRRMTESDRDKCRKAVIGMYKAANLVPPPEHRIVFVPSPFVLAFASGFASAIWWLRGGGKMATDAATNAATDAATHAAISAATDAAIRAAISAATDAATRAATDDATYDATYAATHDATHDATYDATDAATRAATHAATDDATYDATYAATHDATHDATRAATDAATRAATRAATDAATDDAINRDTASKWFKVDVSSIVDLSVELKLGKFGLECAKNVRWKMWNGGNQWSGWTGFLSFFRHVAKLKIDYSKWDHYEVLGTLAGPRVMHKEFCMISERPTKLLVDANNRPHCDNGPFCEWADGTALFSLHGIRVPEWVVMTSPKEMTKAHILNEKNADVRREIIRKVGAERLVSLLDYKVIDRKHGYELINIDLGDKRERPWLKMIGPSTGIVHIEGCPKGTVTVEQAICYRNGLDEFEMPTTLT